ncbi:Uncharacterized protein APZ42_017473 [Daphnia magna]|uniref:Uncharacterized protein n=1 Tax=Daphnia magna TaxID=35525 RepID=A0A164ZVJ9_9CRUS|nr:Uncharacterized protein APZ42_017473 [Daphnia magna]
MFLYLHAICQLSIPRTSRLITNKSIFVFRNVEDLHTTYGDCWTLRIAVGVTRIIANNLKAHGTNEDHWRGYQNYRQGLVHNTSEGDCWTPKIAVGPLYYRGGPLDNEDHRRRHQRVTAPLWETVERQGSPLGPSNYHQGLNGTIQEDYRTTWINAGATNRQGF